ncbi:MAG: hypothetical protein IT385_06070 [Deltaproteobacteria bacterium]|nr:hypothetical protein [Deltaproteobacteria bacterium]
MTRPGARLVRLGVRVAMLGLASAAACVGDLAIDDVPWACTRDAECGWRARCVDRVCVLVGDGADTAADHGNGADVGDADSQGDVTPAEPTGMTCETPLLGTSPDGQAAFTISRREADGRPMITVTLDGLPPQTYPLPPGVEIEGLAPALSGPLVDCCEDPCCPPL